MSFHVNLNEVDPTIKQIPDGVYNYRVLKVEKKSFVSKKDNSPGEFISMTLAITESPDFSGRRVYESLFDGNKTNVAFRLLMDATGMIPGGDGQLNSTDEAVEWLNEIRTAGATFSAPTSTKEETNKSTGEVEPRTRINLYKIGPAQLVA